MLDMIADYQNCKREDRRSAAYGPQTIVDLLKTRRTSGTSISVNMHSIATSIAEPVAITKPTMDNSIVTTATPSDSETMVLKPPRRPKHQVKEFNDIIVCNLCHGYLINATSIDICGHSFCRSCIVKYLDTETNCPQCKPQIAYITISNLRIDDVLRSLVYKLVPGLLQQERERQMYFFKTTDLTPDCDMLTLEEEFFYPAEPISLSLEYHPALLVSCNKSQIPPVRYLQCPAGVTVHHLKRFLCSKYDIDPANQRVDIDIIYEDEILPEDFSLMDVGYCYSWKRMAPMRFCYRILVHNNPSPSPAIRSAETVTTPPDVKVLTENNQREPSNTEAKRVKKSTDAETMAAPMAAPMAPMKTVRFLEPAKKVEKNAENNRQVTYSVFKSKSMDSKDALSNNNNNNNEIEREKNEGNGTMKMIIARKQSPKRCNSDESVYNITNDFKSLRSNDMRYSDYTVTSTTSGGTSVNKKPKEEVKSTVSKCDIVVSIPQSQITRSPNSSDESMENLSLAELKTAGKKNNSNNSNNNSSSPSKKNVPKLKIELNSLKTKITIPKPKSAEVRQEPRKISKRKLSIDEPPVTGKVDLKTYAKNIGLKPINMEKSVDLLEPSKPKSSPDASPMSTSSSTGSSHSNGTFSFAPNDGCSSSSSSHKKRKKKHSKEPKDSNGKRRKLHAEISSQPADESLKMKVKITGSHNHRPHKVENRKSSSSSDEVIVTTPTTTKLPPPVAAAPAVAAVNGNDQRKSPKAAPSPPSPATQTAAQISSAANFNVSNLNRTLSEESSNITSLMSRREAESSKKSTEAKSKTSPLQIMTTIHSRIPSNPQITSTTASKTPLPKPLASIQEMKLPASPPLPPSLFKTTPLTIPTITATSSKPATPPKSVRTNMNPPASGVGQSNRPPKLAPAAPKSQFAVPHPPTKSMPNSPKLCPISSIASSAHKHAAQLKRSASLDGHPPSLMSKHPKTDSEMARKSTYGPVFPHRPNNNKPTTTANLIKHHEKPYYSSSMSSAYTHEVSKRKATPLLLPPSSISVTKMNENSVSKSTHSPSVTITSQPSKQHHHKYSQQSNHKPCLEITRIPTNKGSEQKPSTVKSSPPKATRPPPPPIPLVKIKKSQSQTMPTRSPALTVSTKTTGGGHSQASPPGLISMRSIIPAIVASKSAATNAENAPKQPEKPSSETNGKPPKEKNSLRDRRPSSKDGSVEILDLSGKQSTPPSPSTHTPGDSLEAALKKIKQNMTSSTVPDSIAAANKSPKVDTPPEDLQNLHMLSESATNREKIAIKSLPKLNEISKVRSTQTPVRQQNASVRNIPNPSALAFRNQPTIPMLNQTNNKLSPSSPPTGAAQPEFKVPTPPNRSPSSSTNPGSPPRLKKNLNIEQVAANLNMRAAAAADKSEALSTAAKSASSASAVSASKQENITTKASMVTSSNVVSSSSSSSSLLSSLSLSSSPAATASNRESAVAPTPPKTSFKSISSLVASSSSSSTVSAGTA